MTLPTCVNKGTAGAGAGAIALLIIFTFVLPESKDIENNIDERFQAQAEEIRELDNKIIEHEKKPAHDIALEKFDRFNESLERLEEDIEINTQSNTDLRDDIVDLTLVLCQHPDITC